MIAIGYLVGIDAVRAGRRHRQTPADDIAMVPEPEAF